MKAPVLKSQNFKFANTQSASRFPVLADSSHMVVIKCRQRLYVCPRMRNFFLTFFLLVLGAAFWTSIPSGCANIVPPSGGPRDSLPPQLLKAEPRDSTTNFRGKEIVLNFDEYVDLKDISNNLLFTPTFETNPEIKAKGHTLTIRFRDSLESNTTYVFNFGNAITDINESNVLRNFTYAFSTGPVMDSLEMTGRVQLAETGGIDSTLIVVLHRSFVDSAVYKNRPQYVVRLDRNGAFHFRYLPSDTFAIYAIGDAAFSKKYMNPNQLFAFYDEPVIAGRSDSILLYAYREKPSAVTTPRDLTRFSPMDRRLKFTPATTGNQDLQTDYILNFPVPLKNFDSAKVRLTTDSVFNPTNYTVSLDSTSKELRIKTQWKENTRYNLVLDKDFASDTTGRQLLKTDTLFFTTRKNADYGKLSIRIRNLDTARNPVLQFVQNNQVIQSVPIKSSVFNQALFVPGEYDLRILYDTNNNGKWDPGKFYGAKKQPEIVVPIGQKITVKPDWDNEFERGL